MIELRWVIQPGHQQPKAGAIPIGQMPQLSWQVLQYRTMTNPAEIGLQEAIWSEWQNVPAVWMRAITQAEG